MLWRKSRSSSCLMLNPAHLTLKSLKLRPNAVLPPMAGQLRGPVIMKLLRLVLSAILVLLISPQNRALAQAIVPDVHTLTTTNYSANMYLFLQGYYAANDSGGGTLVQMTGGAHACDEPLGPG